MKVAFLVPAAERTSSGASWLQYLLRGIALAEPGLIRTLVTDTAPSPEWAALFDEVVVGPGTLEPSPGWFGRLRRKLRADGEPEDLRDTVRRAGADAVFGFFLKPSSAAALTLAWLPDLQHRDLPHMFGRAEQERRDRLYLSVAERSDAIVVMSESVRAAFAAFAPALASKFRVVRIGASFAEGALSPDLGKHLGPHDLPDRFLFFPGQFWKHKGHDLLLEALSLVANDALRPHVVMTGPTTDNRHPEYFSELTRRIQHAGLAAQISILGVVPRPEFLGLLRQCVALVNPSRYEGFALTVEEAITIGKPVIASDIAAHREFEEGRITVFANGDAHDLARTLKNTWLTEAGGVQPQREAEAAVAAKERCRNGGRTFLRLLCELRDEKGRAGAGGRVIGQV